MRSRAGLLAELEENRQKNKDLKKNVTGLEVEAPDPDAGYDPYDNPGLERALARRSPPAASRRPLAHDGRRR
ncbi:MAG TPA: hypothetical protein VIS31_02850 [Woeseiaceae bacterium]